jgi:DNA-binding IclR family transcriptional regulator
VSTPIDSVVTTLSIIERMAGAEGAVGVSTLAQAVGSTKARVYRHLRTLVDRGWVEQDADTEKYSLTLRLFHLGQAVAEQTDFLSASRRVIPELGRRTNLSVSVGQIEEDGVRVLDIVKQRSELEISTRPGALFDFHCSAQGKVALAFGPAQLWDRVKRQPLRNWTAHTCTDVGRLETEVRRVRRQGWAVAPEQVLAGINALAAPVFGPDGVLAGTIAVLGSVQFLPPRPVPAQIAAVTDAAAAISARLGFRREPAAATARP